MRNIEKIRLPLSEEMRLKHNFFELYPFDGGGGFIHHQLVGSIDDAEITEHIVKDGVLNDFGGLDALDYRKFERWPTIEKSCWINRLYFVVPMARTARLTKNDKLAELVKWLILDYLRKYPAPAGRDKICAFQRRILESRDRDYNMGENPNGEIEYQWFDFQPASRIVNAINAMNLIRNFSVISDSDWNNFDQWVQIHGENIYLAEKFGPGLVPGNHQALRGTALMYAAAYFADEVFAADWRNEALNICNYHMTEDYLADGLLREISPSYHCFETWIGRDAAALAENYGFKLDEKASEVLGKAVDVCRKLRQPDGMSIVLNDGYSLNMDVFISTFNITDDGAVSEAFLADSGLAVWNRNRFFILLDSSPMHGRFSHYHCGKNGLTLWFDDRPFLIDSGCCSYDDPDFTAWYKLADAHSSLLINGHGDGLFEGCCNWIRNAQCSIEKCEDGTVNANLSSDASEWQNVKWTRNAGLTDKGLVLTDIVDTPEAKQMKFVFILHPDVSTQITADSIILDNHGSVLKLIADSSPEIIWQETEGKVFIDFKSVISRRLIANISAPAPKFITYWIPFDSSLTL